MAFSNVMTIGQLSRRTGVPIKTLREYEQLGLLYTRGRSEGNYRLFGEETLWCVQVISLMRSLGLTLREINELSALHAERPGEPLGPRIGEKLEGVLARVTARITELEQLRERIERFQAAHVAALTGQTELPLLMVDPRRNRSDIAS